MSTLYLITARGGSKKVPGKNIKLLGGIPLIEHTIRHALQVASDPEDVVVSTDSEEIARISVKAGACVPFMRPKELASDTAASRDVILHAVDWFGSDKNYDRVVLLQPTSPFRNIEDIKKAETLFNEKRPDMVVSVRKALSNPYYNIYECRPDGSLFISKGDGMITRRQDAPPAWEFDGSIYVIDIGALRNTPSLARMPRILPVENSCPYNIDIDSEADFILAEYYSKILK